jgi:succinate dehydrogenase/fumarate reductase flavoprotein subunit
VLKFKKDTNQYFKGLYDKFRMQEAARKSAEEILRLEKEGQLFNGWDTSDKGKSKDDGGRTK